MLRTTVRVGDGDPIEAMRNKIMNEFPRVVPPTAQRWAERCNPVGIGNGALRRKMVDPRKMTVVRFRG